MAAQRKTKCLTCERPAEVRKLCRRCHQAAYRAGKLGDPQAVADGLIGEPRVKSSPWSKAAAKKSRKAAAK